MTTNNMLNTPEPFPITAGGTGVSSVTTSPTANAWAGWDGNKNEFANNFSAGYATTATAAGTTTLTAASAYAQFFTGSTTQTVLLPVTSTLALGFPFYIVNLSSGNVTIQSSGGNNIQVMAGGTTAYLTCILTSGTTAASWNVEYAFNGGEGSGTVNTGTQYNLAYYATTGTAVSGLANISSGVLTSVVNVPTWASLLSLSLGGTNAALVASNGGIFYSTASAGAILSGTATATQMLQSGASGAPAWSTSTWPATTTINQLLYSSSANTVVGLATSTTAVLTTAAGVPTWAAQLSLALGGANAALTASNGGIVYSTASALAILAGTATAKLALLSGASGAPSWSSSTPFTQINIQTFTSTGTYTPTFGMGYGIAIGLGAGGGGGGTGATGGAGAGGAAGGLSLLFFTASTIGASKAVTIGAAGTAGSTSGGIGGTGGTTSLGVLISVPGGAGGAGMNAVAGNANGGIPGTLPTGGTINTSGAPGSFSIVTTSITISGAGGSTLFGAGGVGNGTTNAGNAGVGMGAAGAGGAGASQLGGAGSKGGMVIIEFITA